MTPSPSLRMEMRHETPSAFSPGEKVLVAFRVTWTKARSSSDDTILVPCEVLATKIAYGQQRFEIRPVNGHGQSWVDGSRIMKLDK